MDREMRVLVTGSRGWPFSEMVWSALGDIARGLVSGETLTVVHGDCPKGADRMAREWCEDNAGFYDNGNIVIREERHPADWDGLGKRAGFVRNAKMVDLGAHLCLAFILDGSKGASHTVGLVRQAGIPVKLFAVNS